MPLLLMPSEVANIGSITLAEAQSGRFYTDSSLVTEVAREVVAANELHFKGTSVSSASEFWFDYDGIRADYAVTDTYGRNAVWSDYAAVYHLKDTTDSTGTNTLTQVNATFASAKIGNGSSHDGSGDYFYAANNASFNFGDNGDLTFTTWLKTTTNKDFAAIASKVNLPSSPVTQTWIFTAMADRTLQGNNGGSWVGKSSGTITASAWNYVAMKVSSSTVYYYINGSEDSNTYSFSYTDKTTDELGLGTWFSASPTFDLAGQLDEARLRGSALSADWITTEYNNQNDNGAFWVAEDAGGGGGGWNGYPMLHMMQFSAM